MEKRLFDLLYANQKEHWWYAARRVIFERVVGELVAGGLPDGKLYDLGCGVGANLSVLEKFGATIGVDTSQDAVDYCKSIGHDNVVRADLTADAGLPAGDAKLVVLADVIEHIDDEQECLAGVYRLLAPGGALVVTVPAYMFLWGPADDATHHKRRYTEGQVRDVIGERFVVERSTYFNTLLFGLVVGGRFLEKARGHEGFEYAEVPPPRVNNSLRRIFSSESRWVTRHHLPFGVSIMVIARKPAT